MPESVAVVHVVVPAHDEAELLPECLRSVLAAIERLREERPGVGARLTVVLDDCTDDSAAVCRAHGVDVVEVAVRNVGAARAAGTDRARGLASADGVDPARTWIVCTDADCVVPDEWLTDQVAAADGVSDGGADGGADVVLGRVEPDLTAPAEVVASWHVQHDDGRVGVHGAHLGFRLSCHDDVGGWAPLTAGEDLDLYRRLVDGGARYGAATAVVVTSSRLVGRTDGGFSAYLSALAQPGTSQARPDAPRPVPPG